MYNGLTGKVYNSPNSVELTEYGKTGDIITIILDIENEKIIFGLNNVIFDNNKSQTVNNIPHGIYRLAVGLWNIGDKVEILKETIVYSH